MKISLKHGAAYLHKVRGYGWYLDSIIVDEAHRNEGIGTKLMEKIISKCDDHIFLLASCELGGQTDRLIDFYKRFGFEYQRRMTVDLGLNYNMVR